LDGADTKPTTAFPIRSNKANHAAAIAQNHQLALLSALVADLGQHEPVAIAQQSC
jgi:hypothetical protein